MMAAGTVKTGVTYSSLKFLDTGTCSILRQSTPSKHQQGGSSIFCEREREGRRTGGIFLKSPLRFYRIILSYGTLQKVPSYGVVYLRYDTNHTHTNHNYAHTHHVGG